jgi:hypothetical protein
MTHNSDADPVTSDPQQTEPWAAAVDAYAANLGEAHVEVPIGPGAWKTLCGHLRDWSSYDTWATTLSLPALTVPTAIRGAEALHILGTWARATHFVDDDVFDRSIEATEDASVMRAELTFLVENREIIKMSGQGWREHEAVSKWPHQPQPQNYAKTVNTYLLDGSINVLTCHECQSVGKTSCDRCAGAGRSPCPPETKCDHCRGVGHTGFGENLTSCSSCAGLGRQFCKKCSGSGWTQCWRCLGDGKVTCSLCHGSGQLTSYTTLVATREPVGYRYTPAEDALPIKIKKEDWTVAAIVTPAAIPAGLSSAEEKAIGALIDRHRPIHTLLSVLTVEFAPITSVSYSSQDGTKRAWIVGNGTRVVAPDATKARRGIFFVASALAIALAIAATVLIVLLT